VGFAGARENAKTRAGWAAEGGTDDGGRLLPAVLSPGARAWPVARAATGHAACRHHLRHFTRHRASYRVRNELLGRGASGRALALACWAAACIQQPPFKLCPRSAPLRERTEVLLHHCNLVLKRRH